MQKKNKKIIWIVVIVALILCAFIGFRIYNNITTAKQKAAAITKGRVVTVDVMPAFRKTITPVIVLSASLEPIWYSDISPKVDGRIGRILTDEGQVVSAGQVVATIENNEFAAQVSQAQGTAYAARADLAQARADLARYESLYAQGAISAQQFEAMRTKAASLEGLLRATEGNIGYMEARLNNTDVVTPHAGTVIKRYLQTGDYAKAGTPIFNIADLSVLVAKATVGESQINQIVLGAPARVVIDALAGQEFSGSITKVSPAAIVPAHTFNMEVSLDNSENILRSGMFAKVVINGKEHPQALVVPESAIVLFEDQRSVFVLVGDQVQQRKLKLGYVGDGWAEVLSGLNPGDLVVVSGQNITRDGSKVTVAAIREAGQL
ncbi:MAG: efflux transporter, family, subunit [Firmicutes bacterium]|nr:efflux transporter, family, subunit [Bacillota bacterium]